MMFGHGNVEADLANRFSYHAPKGDQPQRYVELRGAAHALAQMVVNLCPDSRERSLALTKLEEAVMWANASIARKRIGGSHGVRRLQPR